jgi:hypothetical protein
MRRKVQLVVRARTRPSRCPAVVKLVGVCHGWDQCKFGGTSSSNGRDGFPYTRRLPMNSDAARDESWRDSDTARSNGFWQTEQSTTQMAAVVHALLLEITSTSSTYSAFPIGSR